MLIRKVSVFLHATFHTQVRCGAFEINIVNLKEKLDKIDSEIENGLKFKATDRLRNLIQENPNEIELWNKLAELYYESGFFDSAGKYWILTEPTDDRIKKCVEIYEKSVNNSGYQILKELVFRGDKSKLSDYAQKKLTELESDSKEKANYIPKFNPKTNKQKKNNSNQEQTFKEKLGGFIFFSILVSIIILIIIGFVTVVQWIF
ncbi:MULTISPECIES: DUF6584 family protein [unclassified Tenacibaculum]|uniref:DUF6584 family protein n=1 Tax=unclassified Tenacibaculum TaxID=2635139 RepID=UPI003BACC7AD